METGTGLARNKQTGKQARWRRVQGVGEEPCYLRCRWHMLRPTGATAGSTARSSGRCLGVPNRGRCPAGVPAAAQLTLLTHNLIR